MSILESIIDLEKWSAKNNNNNNSRFITVSNSRYLTILFVICFLLYKPTFIQSASFYGQSYLKLSLLLSNEPRNSSQTEIEFRFKTHQSNAFLFLAAGPSDYYLIYLDHGRVAVKINLESGETYLSSDNELALNNLQWHHVTLRHRNKNLSLKIGDKVYIHSTQNDYEDIDFNSHNISSLPSKSRYTVSIGGQDPHLKSLNFYDKIRPLRGCLDKVWFNQRDMLDLSIKNGIIHEVSMDEVCDEEYSNVSAQASNTTIISFTQADSFVLFPSFSSLESSEDFDRKSKFPQSRNQTLDIAIQFDLKTISENALLWFWPGKNSYKKEFLAVEIIKKRLRLTVSNGTLENQIDSKLVLHGSHWHHVELNVDTENNLLKILVNGKIEKSSINNKSFILDFGKLSNEQFCGGLSSSKQSLAINYNLESVLVEQNVSLKGCLKNIKINLKPIGLLDALVTNKIKTGKCKWHFLCFDQKFSPCIKGSRCIQLEINKIKCLCQQNDFCVKPTFKHKNVIVESEQNSQCLMDLYETTTVDVLEGSNAILNNKVLFVLKHWPNFYYDNLWIRVKQKPKHGSIYMANKKLGFHDLNTVIYTHDGSDNYNDTVKLELENLNNQNHLTVQYQNLNSTLCNRFVLTIFFNIKPLNDAPTTRFSKNVVIRILKNSKLTLNPSSIDFFGHQEYLKETKKNYSSIVYKVFKIENQANGHFERMSKPDYKISEFNETELQNGNIQFVHVAQSNEPQSLLLPIEIILHIYHSSKENSTKPDSEFRITFEPYELKIIKQINTGLEMAHHTFAFITSANLSLLLENSSINQNDNNADKKKKMKNGNESHQIKYELTNGPEYGIIQKLRSAPSHWTNVTQFTQRQINRFKIRYLHLHQTPNDDRFTIRVLFNKQKINSIEFEIKFFDQLKMISFGVNHYNISKNEKEFIINNRELSFQTEPVLSEPQEILLTIDTVPSYGTLYLLQTNTLQTHLKALSMFTQKDIDENRLLYVKNSSLLKADENSTIDKFSLNVHRNKSRTAKLFIEFFVNFESSLHSYTLINKKLTVLEGNLSVIDDSHLFVHVSKKIDSESEEQMIELYFEITEQPKFGWLKILNAKNGYETIDKFSEIQNLKKFNISVIKQNKLFYVHDDSENNFDYFKFVVRNSLQADRQILKGTFIIDIEMKNDNQPIRKVSKTLNVIRNEERILRNTDICFDDDDLNTFPSNITYTKIHSSNGQFYFLNDTIAQSFTQQDIDNGLVKFRHNGSDLARTNFWITDNQFFLSSYFEIRASDPFIKIRKNSGIVVRYGENCVISAQNLSIETNFPDIEKIYIKLITEPSFGQILINDKTVNEFTLKELNGEMVEYESTVFEDEPPFSKNDTFEFKVFSANTKYTTKETMLENHKFSIRIFPPSYFNLNIVKQNNLTAFEKSQSIIDSKTLLIEHMELKPNQIWYTIIKQPNDGTIKNLRSEISNLKHSFQTDKTILTMKFTQQDINDGQIIYVNSRMSPIEYNDSYENDLSFVDERLWDWFMFEVGNDIFKLTNLTCYIEVIPNEINLITNNISVIEGQTIMLSNKYINLAHWYYRKNIDQFIVVEEPKYGTISMIDSNNIKLSVKYFTSDQLNNDQICYQHDSSEFERDWFTIVARSNSIDAESLPATVHIFINSINDEPPTVVNISDLYIWKDERAQITGQHLTSIDKDSPTNEIIYVISTPINGYVINIETNTTIDRFTQEDIDLGKIYFVHVGTENGSFRFTLTDGKNYGSSNIFKIKVKVRELKIEINEKLFVAPGMQQSITRNHLQMSTNDDKAEKNFTYRIIKAPTYGQIILESFKEQSKVTENFTQKQLNENLVVYDQNVPIVDPIIMDRVIFDIDSPNVPTLKSVHFFIEIAVESIKEFISSNKTEEIATAIKPIKVEEGKIGVITRETINLNTFLSKLKYNNYDEHLFIKELGKPLHGILLKSGKKLQPGMLISINYFDDGSIVYMHDDSNTFNDSIQFGLFINNNFLISILNLTLPIEIIAVNDEYPIVIKRNPKLKALFESKTQVSREILLTRDDDGNNTKIIYLFNEKSLARDGFFTFCSHENMMFEFTQQDINQNRICFFHKGPKTKFTFWFRVKDDEMVKCPNDEIPNEISYQLLLSSISNSHCSPYYPFLVEVNKKTLRLINHTSIHLQQGSLRALITKANLAASDSESSDLNDLTSNFNVFKASEIVYQVKNEPSFGYISVNGYINQQMFNQQQINENQVVYVQVNLSSFDSFSVDLYCKDDSTVRLYQIDIKLIVIPMIKAIKPFLLTHPGEQSQITLDYLDASELSFRTDSDPRFTIMKNPSYGTIRLLRFGKDEEDNEGEIVTEFTNEDIIKNRIVYKAAPNLNLAYPNEILVDVIDYYLSAADVQQAHGILVVNILNLNSTLPTLSQFNADIYFKNHYHYFKFLSWKFVKQQFMLIVALIIILLLVIPSLYFAMRLCNSWRYNATQNQKSQKQTIRISCPPPQSVLEHNSNTLSTKHNDNSSSRSSSNSTFDNHQTTFVTPQPLTHSVIPLDKPTYLSSYHKSHYPYYQQQLKMNEKIDMQVLRGGSIARRSRQIKRDEQMSPLPPPSLYFVNERSFNSYQNEDQEEKTNEILMDNMKFSPAEIENEDWLKDSLKRTQNIERETGSKFSRNCTTNEEYS